MRIPQFARQVSNAPGNPLASSHTSTQNAAKATQPAMNMPEYMLTNRDGILCAKCIPTQGNPSCTFGYMEPQYAQYGYTPSYNFM